MNLSRFLAVRLGRQTGRDRLISFITASSTIGIGLGCFALIVILSVMNGFERELGDKVLSRIPHGELTAVASQGLEKWPEMMQQIQNEPGVKFAQPVIKVTAMLQHKAKLKAAQISAVDPRFLSMSGLATSLSENDLTAFTANEDGILLGQRLRKILQLDVGDEIQLVLPQYSEDGRLRAPQTRWLKVIGEFSLGNEADGHVALMHLSLAADLLGVQYGASTIQIVYQDPYTAPIETRRIANQQFQRLYLTDWTRTQGNLYQDILLVRQVAYVVLALVIAVACFNIVSAQIMSVSEKAGEIAMLMTMGATTGLIMRTFVLRGAANGIKGTFVGASLGILTASYLSQWVGWFETTFNIQVLSSDVYFIDFLPSELHFADVWLTVAIALIMSLLATIYPAYKAAQISPAKVLGH